MSHPLNFPQSTLAEPHLSHSPFRTEWLGGGLDGAGSGGHGQRGKNQTYSVSRLNTPNDMFRPRKFNGGLVYNHYSYSGWVCKHILRMAWHGLARPRPPQLLMIWKLGTFKPIILSFLYFRRLSLMKWPPLNGILILLLGVGHIVTATAADDDGQIWADGHKPRRFDMRSRVK